MSQGTRSVLSVGRLVLHHWLTRAASWVRAPDPDLLLDRLRPGGPIAQAFLEAGLARHHAGQGDASRAILERGARAFPENLALIQAVASLTRESGRLPLAMTYWEAAWQRAGDAPTACGLSASLRANLQPARASSIIEAAVARFPDDPGVVAEAARVAAARGRHERALQLWGGLVARDPTPEARAGRDDALAAAEDAAGAQRRLVIGASGVDPAVPEVFITLGELMLEFESLGDNCEFGLAQRYCGVDPLGLFRFTESEAPHLDHAFSTGFEHYGTEEDLVLDQRHGDEEYLGTSHHYGGFKYHTEIFGPGVDVAELRKTELRKLAYLKQRMLSDVRSGEKIFVRKQGDRPWAMRLSRTIRAMGPNVFLWLEVADGDHPGGHVEIVEPGLLRGYVSKFAWYGDARTLELEDWTIVCLNALGLAKAFKGQRVRYRLPDNQVLQTGRGWDIAKRCHARQVEDPSFHGHGFPGHEVTQLTLLEDTVRWDAIIAEQVIEAPVWGGSQFVFSLWILVPAAFQGTFVDLYFTQSPEGYLRRADLDKRDVWQRIYATTKMPKDLDVAMISLRVTGRAGDVLHIATWRLEQGFVPNKWPVEPRSA